jgi:hypothetical protein
MVGVTILDYGSTAEGSLQFSFVFPHHPPPLNIATGGVIAFSARFPQLHFMDCLAFPRGKSLSVISPQAQKYV